MALELFPFIAFFPPPKEYDLHSSVAMEPVPNLNELIAACQPFIAPDDPNWREIERVNIFWNGRYYDMFVDEHSVAKGLPVNPRATELYHNNMKVHAPERLGPNPPSVYGPAVVFLRRVWF